MMFHFSYTSWKWQFLGKNISQGSVATHLRCGGIFNNHSTTNFLKNPSVKEFRKSIKIWQHYGYECDAPFFWRHSVHLICTDQLWLICVAQMCGQCLRGDNDVASTRTANDRSFSTIFRLQRKMQLYNGQSFLSWEMLWSILVRSSGLVTPTSTRSSSTMSYTKLIWSQPFAMNWSWYWLRPRSLSHSLIDVGIRSTSS